MTAVGLKAIVLGAITSATAAHGCEQPPVAYPDRNKRTKVAPDCSFKYAGRSTKYKFRDQDVWFKFVPSDNVTGAAAINVGGNKVSQVVTQWGSCEHDEFLLVADCKHGDVMGFEGRHKASIAGYSGSFVSEIVVPNGALDVNSSATLSGLREEAEAAEVAVIEDLGAFQSGWKKSDRFNPFCGCKLFYPDSIGAKK